MGKFRGYFRDLARSCQSIAASLKTTLPYFLGSSADYRAMTEEYPDRVSARTADDLPVRYRGFLHNDISKCSGCRFCEEQCPVDCIKIETEPGPQSNVSWVSVFEIDHARCMFCGLCVEVCPTKSLVHTREYEGASTELRDLVKSFGKGWATEEMRKRWREEQQKHEGMAETHAQYERSPIGAEVLRRRRGSDEGESK